MPFQFEETEIPDVIHVLPEVFEDGRGCLLETYDEEQFAEAGIDVDFALDLLSVSAAGVVRGLHFQREPFEQAKLVQCVSGSVFDVAVDIREGSPSFGKYVSRRLEGDEKDALFVPPGFAHGFAVLEDDAKITYKLDAPYAPEYEAGIHWNDPSIGIDWPLTDPVVSSDDRTLPTLAEAASAEDLF